MGDLRRRQEAATDPQLSRPDKRNASRSPDRARPLKQTRPDVESVDNSRQSSTSNRTPHHVRAESPSRNRRPSLHDGVEQNGVKGLSSPDARSEMRDRASSGRSTPKQQHVLANGASMKPDVGPSPTPITQNNVNVIAALGQFISHAGEYAALQHRKDEVEARYKRADSVYQANKLHFGSFPALKDRKTRPRDTTQEELRVAQQKLDAHTAEQRAYIATLAALITPVQQPLLTKEDFVSICAFDSLKSTYGSLQKDMGDLKAKVTTNTIECDHVKTVQKNTVEQLKKAETAYEISHELQSREENRATWRSTIDERLSRIDDTTKAIPDIRSRVQELSTWKQTANAKIENVDQMNETASKLGNNVGILFGLHKEAVDNMAAMTKSLDEVEKQWSATRNDVSGLRDVQSTLGEQVGQLAGGKPESVKMSIPELEKQLHSVNTELAKVKNGVPSKAEHIGLEERQDRFDQRLGTLEGFLKRNKSPSARDSVRLEGDVSPSVRVVAIEDRPVTSPEMAVPEGPIFEEKFAKLEKRLEELEGRKKHRYAGSGQQPEDSLPPLDLPSLQAECRSLRADLESLWDSQGEIQDTTLAHIDGISAKVESDISDLRIARVSDQENLHDTLAAAEMRMNELQQSLQLKASDDSYAALRNVVEKLSRSMELVIMKQDQLTGVFEHLKRRYDNLSTEELVKCMLSQFSALWPNSANIELSFKQHGESVRRLQGDVEKLRSDATKTGLIGGFRNPLHDLEQSVNNAVLQSNEHKALFEKLNVDQVLSRVESLAAKVSEHDGRLDEVDAMGTAIAGFQASSEAVQKSLGELAGKVDAVQQFIEN